jgi:hypothetical protein
MSVAFVSGITVIDTTGPIGPTTSDDSVHHHASHASHAYQHHNGVSNPVIAEIMASSSSASSGIGSKSSHKSVHLQIVHDERQLLNEDEDDDEEADFDGDEDADTLEDQEIESPHRHLFSLSEDFNDEDDDDASHEDEEYGEDDDHEDDDDEDNNVNVNNRRHLLSIDEEEMGDDDHDEDDEDDDNEEGKSNGRKLLRFKRVVKAVKRIFHRPSPPPRAAPSPAPRTAPSPAPRAAPSPAPKAAPSPAPKAAPVHSPKVSHSSPNVAPSPKVAHSSPKVAHSSSSKGKKNKSKDKKKDKIVVIPTIPHRVTTTTTTTTTKSNTILKKRENELNAWLSTEEGLRATGFCRSLGIERKFDVFNGCLFDMYTTKSEEIARESALSAEEFSSLNNVLKSKKFCVASGDPHFTNYDGDFFHLQEPGIYTIARTRDGKFEIQEKMRKNGANRPGVPACITGAVFHYKNTNIEIDVSNFEKIKINGREIDLPKDFPLMLGGVRVSYGKQSVEWRGEKATSNGLKVTTPNGFGAMITGGYCGTLETNVPQAYFGKMEGICGNADGAKDARDYFDPSGKVMDVRRGTRRWEMSGYGGASSPLSKWQLAWKPKGDYCYFSKDCEAGGPKRPVSPTPSITYVKQADVVPVTPSIIDSKKSQEKVEEKKEEKKEVKKEEDKKEKKQEEKKEEKKEDDKKEKKEEEKKEEEKKEKEKKEEKKEEEKKEKKEEKEENSSTVKKTIHKIRRHSRKTLRHIKEMHASIRKMLAANAAEHKRIAEENKKAYDGASETLKHVILKLNVMNTHMLKVERHIKYVNASVHTHYKQMLQDTAYLQKLDLIKPKFLRSLDALRKRVIKMHTVVSKTLLPDEYKDIILNSLAKVDISSVNITTSVADAFLKHYEKYKSIIKMDGTKYNERVEKLNKLVDRLSSEKLQIKEIASEYSRVMELVNKLRRAYESSTSESRDFDELVKRFTRLLSRSGHKCRRGKRSKSGKKSAKKSKSGKMSQSKSS